MDHYIRQLASPAAFEDERLAFVANAWFAAKDVIRTWDRCTVMLVDESASAGVIREVHLAHRCKTRRDRLHVQRQVKDAIATLRFDPENSPSVTLAKIEGGWFLVLYKTLCVDWVKHRFSIRSEKVPRKLLKLDQARIERRGVDKQASFDPRVWMIVVQLTAVPKSQACAVCDRSPDARKSFPYCGKCGVFKYCSKACQREHWKEGHKDMCDQYRTAEGKSFMQFRDFVAAYGRDVDPDARVLFVNAASMAREFGLVGSTAEMGPDVLEMMLKSNTFDLTQLCSKTVS